ncbi:GNAT family N-acetyltransferase [Granulicella arctica]|uniref:Ribosomal protein S18 acetylase RimI-like enzyme n=1 Tax=Granulicella arctica TaxID=940613 RepID=A0A7Y9PHP7_9BACT|nr:GNAT family N-acetyltransferase [Granulicella arctica]NYF79371.1 ribosomal protein S18 acetylase RimI-like enzyme [Granulicella arctica]
MTVATQLELLDLRHFSARQLRPLLEREAQVWKERLRWDYQNSTELLLQYLDSRVLPGFVALDRGKICGFTFCVYEGHKAVVGDAYAIASDATTSLKITHRLLQHLLELLLHSPNIERIESQLLLYDAGAIDEVFVSAGFAMFPRMFMELNLEDYQGSLMQSDERTLPQEIELRRWSNGDYQQAAELIHMAYADHIDAQVNDQYRSLHGSLRFLHNIIRFPGCGVFASESSWVLRERNTQTLVGIVLCSDVGGAVAHITQLCIAPAWRGHGLAKMMMQCCAEYLRRDGFQAITLTVTTGNTAAVSLYEQLGFEIRHRFDAMVFEREPE